MAIHNASDDQPIIDTYCTLADVLQFAVGIDTDDYDNVLSSLGGTTAARDAFIKLQIPLAFDDVNQWARRDFALHSAKTVVMDGNNMDAAILAERGFWPLISVASLTIDDTVIDTDDYLTYLGREATLEYAESSVWVPPQPKRVRNGQLFTGGRQNVSIVMTWGYAVPPAKIVAAQAQAVISRCLVHMGVTTDPKSPGIPAGVNQISEGQFKTTYNAGARYASSAKAFERLAMRACHDFHRAKALFAIPQENP